MKQVEREMSEWPIKNKRRKKYVYCRESEYELYDFPVEPKENNII